MKTKNTLYALCLAVLVIAVSPTGANANNLLDMANQLDQLDKQDLQSLLDKANGCTRTRNFSCSEEQLRKAAKLVNGSEDKRALNAATQNLQAEQQRVREEALAKAEQERQMWLAEKRAKERREEARREEEQAEERRRMAQRERDAAESSRNSFMEFQQNLNNMGIIWRQN